MLLLKIIFATERKLIITGTEKTKKIIKKKDGGKELAFYPPINKSFLIFRTNSTANKQMILANFI